MKVRPTKSSAGFTYLAALMLVMVMGIMLGVAAQSWSVIMKREREAELLYRGRQIVEAIYQWQFPQRGAVKTTRPSRALNDLKDLMADTGSAAKKRFLRKDPTKDFLDPITGKEWEVLRDNARGGIYGVRSTSEEEPLRQKNFLEMNYPLDPRWDGYLINMYKSFEGKTKYKDWVFAVNP